MVGAEVQRGLMGGGCSDGAAYTPVKAEEPSSVVESTGLSFSSFWDWHKVGNGLMPVERVFISHQLIEDLKPLRSEHVKLRFSN